LPYGSFRVDRLAAIVLSMAVIGLTYCRPAGG
jgi:hypothetical protein